jgi:hypothetical protein
MIVDYRIVEHDNKIKLEQAVMEMIKKYRYQPLGGAVSCQAFDEYERPIIVYTQTMILVENERNDFEILQATSEVPSIHKEDY